VGEFAEVVAGMDAEKLAGRGGGDGGDFHGDALGDKDVMGLRELFHGEGMAGREGEEKVRVVEAAEARRHGGTIRRCGEKGNRREHGGRRGDLEWVRGWGMMG